MIRSGIHQAESEGEKEAVYRLRYDVYLLEQPRAADFQAATDARILSLSEGTLRKLIASDPDVAAQLLLNVSKMLCRRILNG
jgi:CRP-like cAMP-binding protein